MKRWKSGYPRHPDRRRHLYTRRSVGHLWRSLLPCVAHRRRTARPLPEDDPREDDPRTAGDERTRTRRSPGPHVHREPVKKNPTKYSSGTARLGLTLSSGCTRARRAVGRRREHVPVHRTTDAAPDLVVRMCDVHGRLRGHTHGKAVCDR